MLCLAIGVALAMSAPAWVSEHVQGKTLYEQGRITDAIVTLEKAMHDAVAAHALELDTTCTLDTLGAAYEKVGRLGEAHDAFARVLSIRRASLKSPDQQIAISLTNESSVYWAMAKPDQAVTFAEQAKQMWEALGQTNRREYLIAVNDVIAGKLLRGQLQEMASLAAMARELYAREVPSSDTTLPLSLSVLAAAYRSLGEYSEAATIAEEALRIANAQTAPAAVLSKLQAGLGDIRSSQGRLVEAERMLTESVAAPPGVSLIGVVDRASSYRALGRVERLLGKYDRANAADRRALQLLGNTHGQADLVRGDALHELGEVAEEQKKSKDAERYFKEAIDTLESAFSAGHPSISSTYSDLASLYMEEHHYKLAESLYRKVLAQERTALPAEHPSIARDLNNLGSLEFRRRRFANAEELFRRATDMMEHTLGAGHENTGLVEANLAHTLLQRKNYREARTHYVHALGTLGRSWGEDDPRLMPILDRFASLSRAQANPGEMEQLVTRMERIRVRQAIARDRQRATGAS